MHLGGIEGYVCMCVKKEKAVIAKHGYLMPQSLLPPTITMNVLSLSRSLYSFLDTKILKTKLIC